MVEKSYCDNVSQTMQILLIQNKYYGSNLPQYSLRNTTVFIIGHASQHGYLKSGIKEVILLRCEIRSQNSSFKCETLFY